MELNNTCIMSTNPIDLVRCQSLLGTFNKGSAACNYYGKFYYTQCDKLTEVVMFYMLWLPLQWNSNIQPVMTVT